MGGENTAATAATHKAAILSRSRLLALAVFALTFLLYTPSLRNGFVYDDRLQIERDSYVHTPANIGHVLSLAILREDVMDRTRPAMVLSLLADSLLWGRRPMGYHLTNILLHALCAALLFFLLSRFAAAALPSASERQRLLAALAGSLLFAVHPLMSEAVCMVTYREDLLVTAFMLAALLAAEGLDAARAGRRVGAAALIAALCLLATMTKENGILAPLLVFAYWRLVPRPAACRQTAWLWATGAGLALSGVFLVVAHSVTPAVDNSLVWYKPGWLGGNTRAMLSIEPSILAYQLAHVLAPLGLSATYTSYSMRFFPWWLALSGLGACAALAVTAARRHPATRAPLLFFVIALVPTANVVPLYVPAADRYLYLPMVGLAMLLTFAVAACPAPGAFARAARMRRAGLVLLSLLLISFAALALQRQSVWHDEVSLWRNALRTAPDSPAALLNLADACAERGDQRAAMNLRQNAVAATQGASAPAWAALAVGFAQTAQPALADRAYARAVAVDSRYADVVRLERSMRWDEGQMRALREMAGRRAK